MPAITISRQYGSEGDWIAAQVAKALGYHLADKAFIGQLLAEYGLIEFEREYETIPAFWERFDAQRERRRQQMTDMLNRVIQTLAWHGHIVIVGRSSFAVLRPFADVLNVRVQAPTATRIARVMAWQGLSFAEAEALVTESDRVRAHFIESFYETHWNDADAFDLVIDTGKITPDMATTWLIQAVKALEAQRPPEAPTVAALTVDPILARVVTQALACEARPG
jgi:cytidylate kinase